MIALLLCTAREARCEIISAQSGPWSNPATWAGGRVPQAGDAVTISDGHTIALDHDVIGLQTLQVGTHGGSQAMLLYDGGAAGPVTLSFSASGTTRYGIHLFGTLQIVGTDQNQLTLTTVLTDGSASTFIQVDPTAETHVVVKNTIFHFVGDSANPGVSSSPLNHAGESFDFEGNTLNHCGAILLQGADGTVAAVSIQGNQATHHQGSFVQFIGGRNLSAVQNQITVEQNAQNGEAVLDAVLGGTASSGITFQGNTLISTAPLNSMTVDASGHSRTLYGIWVNQFSGSTVSLNLIQSQGVQYGFEEGIAIAGNEQASSGTPEANSASNIIVEQNSVSDTIHGIGIHSNLSGDPGIVVRRNRVFDNRNEHIYVSSGEGTLIVNNIAYGSLAPGFNAILLYSTNQAVIVNNTLEGNQTQGANAIQVGSNSAGTDFISLNATILNNILSDWANGINNEPNGANSFVEVGYNLFSGVGLPYAGTPIPGTRPGDLQGNPLFVGISQDDFHLQSGSPAIGMGTSTDAPSIDFDGNPRPQPKGFDAGAFEFILSPPAQPPAPGAPPSKATTPGAQPGGGCAIAQDTGPPRKTGEAFSTLLLLGVPFWRALIAKFRFRLSRGCDPKS